MVFRSGRDRTRGGNYFRGFIAFEELKYWAIFRVVEASAIKQSLPQSNFGNIAKKRAKAEVGIKGL